MLLFLLSYLPYCPNGKGIIMGISKIKAISLKDFIEIVNSSKTIEEALLKIGYSVQRQKTIEDFISRCEEEKINYKHLLAPDGYKRCIQCKELKEDDLFYKGRKLCKECVKENERKKYQNFKKQINKYKSDKGCAKCGCKKFYVLDFHHKDPNEKEFTISDSTRVKFESILSELNKCIILCANCHREFHWLNDNYQITIEEYLSAK